MLAIITYHCNCEQVVHFFLFYLKGSRPLLDYLHCARVQIRHQMVSTDVFMMSASIMSCRISRIYHSSH